MKLIFCDVNKKLIHCMTTVFLFTMSYNSYFYAVLKVIQGYNEGHSVVVRNLNLIECPSMDIVQHLQLQEMLMYTLAT